jgi:carbon monoxide dehydrogenase subunit G
MFKKILLGLVVLIAVFCVVASFRPDEFNVARSATISAPPAAVFEKINNLQNWNAWSPWAKLDPNAKNTFEGPSAGVGASFAWAGNSQVGEGKMTITESQPNERVVMKLDFVKPFAGTNYTEFVLKPEGNQTAVSWTMSGKANFISKCMGLVMDCDKMVGGQFEQGFSNLKALVEKTPQS